MEEYFAGYLLDALDDGTARQVEVYLEQHPEAREKLALLKSSLEPLEADLGVLPPPPDLAVRTIARVAEHLCAPKDDLAILPAAPPPASVGGLAVRSWWRRPDVLVAASIMLTILGIGAIAIAKFRAPSSEAMVAECRNNLRAFFVALQAYRDIHGQFPDISKEDSPRNVAGMVVPILLDAGTLPETASIRCPAIGPQVGCAYSLQELRQMNGADFNRRSAGLSLCYAYSLGFRDASGKLHVASETPEVSWSQLPIMADRPPTEGILRNSINHATANADGMATGQNVLFADGHIQYLRQRTYGLGDDIFVNRNNQVAAGLDMSDVVLGYSSARP